MTTALACWPSNPREEERVPKIYLDVCCLNRPFDDQTQARIHLEAEAIMMILAQCEAGHWEWLGSEVIDLEIAQTPDPERRRRVRLLASHAHRSIVVGKSETERAQQFEARGISAFDALHLACAESGEADVFLTTDDKLLRKLAAHAVQLHVRVENPLVWLREVSE
jgi:predicted nucleic acid-binding protein